jgi:hypothetical protein
MAAPDTDSEATAASSAPANEHTLWKVWLHPEGANHAREVLQYARGDTRAAAIENAKERNEFAADRARTRRLGPESEVKTV